MNLPPYNDGLFSNTNGIIKSTAWRAWYRYVQDMLLALSGGGGLPIVPSGTVVSETLYGQIPSAGVALSYSRGDHTHGSPTMVSVAGAPLTQAGTVITFNYDAVSLGVAGNNLYVVNDGHTHDTQYLKLDGSNANVTIDINDEDFTTTGQLFINHDTVGTVTENVIEAEGELQSTTQDTTMNFFLADMDNGPSYPSAGTQIKCGFVISNVCRHNQTGGTYRHYGAYFNMGSIAEIPGAPLVVNHDLYGARIGRGTLCVSNALGGSWQDINAYGIYLYGWGGAGDDASGLANLNRWAIYSDGGDVELTNGNLTTTGNITCNTLNYTALNPPIAAAGANTQVQVNNAGAFGADANFTYDFAGNATLGTSLAAGTLTLAGGSITDSTGTISFGNEDLITTGQINIRDAAIYMHSGLDGWLNLVADIGVEVNAPILNVSALYSAGDIDTDTHYEIGAATVLSIDGTQSVRVGIGISAVGTNFTAMGYQAGNAQNVSGNDNSFYGCQTGYATTHGVHNTAMGSQSLKTITFQARNVAVGYKALTLCAANDNTAVGAYAGQKNNSGDKNVYIGTYCGYNLTSGTKNVLAGYKAGYVHGSNEAVVIGYQAGRLGCSLTRTVIIGAEAGYYNCNTASGGAYNIYIGYQAGYYQRTGNYNTMLGYQSGHGAATYSASSNVFLGYQAGYNETGSHKLYIENSNSATPLIYGEFDNDLVKINGDLEVTDLLAVGTTKDATITIKSARTATSGAAAQYGMSISLTQSVANANNVTAAHSVVYSTHTVGAIGEMKGYYGGAVVNSNLAVTGAYGVFGEALGGGGKTAAVTILSGLVSSTDAQDLAVTYGIGYYGMAPLVSGGGSIAVAMTLYCAEPTAGTTNWSASFDGDVQINSNKKLLLEGSTGAKGDSFLRFDSANNWIEHFVNNTESLRVTASDIDVLGPIKVNSTQVVTDQQNHIIDADGTLPDITTKFNTLLSHLETHGLLANV